MSPAKLNGVEEWRTGGKVGGRQWRNIGDRTTPPYHHPGSGRANFCLFVEGSGRAMCLIAGIAPRPDDFLGSVFDMLVLDIFHSTGRFMIFALVPRSGPSILVSPSLKLGIP